MIYTKEEITEYFENLPDMGIVSVAGNLKNYKYNDGIVKIWISRTRGLQYDYRYSWGQESIWEILEEIMYKCKHKETLDKILSFL